MDSSIHTPSLEYCKFAHFPAEKWAANSIYSNRSNQLVTSDGNYCQILLFVSLINFTLYSCANQTVECKEFSCIYLIFISIVVGSDFRFR